MSTSTAVHSNAFNFMSFLQSGVDPRTGQYTVSLTLPEVEANALLGPALNLALFFNPLNTQDSGYGKGWNLQLSQFDPENQVVALHTGESFKATRTAGTELFMEEKKLDSFKLHQKAEPGTGLAYYEVRHRSGLIEKLQRFEASRPLYLPAEIRTAQTRPLKLAYTPFIETSGKRARFEKLFKGRFQYTLTKLFNRFAWFEKLFKRHCQYTLTELFNQTHYRLASIQGADADGNYRDLLTVERTTTALTITLNPAGAPQQQAVFVLQLDGEGKVTELQLPSVGGNQGKWRFRYESHHGHDCLTEVRTPTGAWELIEYDPEGHGFSNGISGRLPRVARHEIRPGDKDGPAAANKPCNQVFTYSYALTTGDADYQAGNNFLGANLALGDPDPTPGLDILYRHSGSYRYGSVEQLRAVDGSVARTLERQFNKFHLLAWEQERQGPADDQHLRTVETTYSYDPAKPFKDQRADCQLPQDTTTRWRKRSSGDERQEVIKRTYHDDGNLHTEEQPNGVIETSLWYPSTGEGSDCPADPDGFARHLKSKTTTPGPGAQAPTLRTRYRYRTLAALPGNTQDQSWHVVDEELLEQMTGEQASTLQSIQHTYYDDSNDAFIHGRLHSQALTMNGLTTLTRYAYALGTATDFGSDQAEQTVLSIEQMVMGHEYDPDNEALKGVYKITRSERSLLTGEPLLSEDDKGVKISYQYDVLRRVTMETVAPDDDEFKAERIYSYTLCATDQDRAQQQRTDVNGVVTTTYTNGLNGPVKEMRNDLDNAVPPAQPKVRDLYEATFDFFGRLLSETEVDWLSENTEADLKLSRTYDYDLWGQQRSVTGPDGVQVVEENDPVGEPNPDLPSGPRQRITRQYRLAAGGAKSGIIKTWVNLFGEAERIERLEWSGTGNDYSERMISLQVNAYDGLGRLLRETTGFVPKRTNAYTYDPYNRLLEHTLPEGAKVLREYAEHSSADLPTVIKVSGVVLGLQAFDGLDRRISATTGGRVTTYQYEQGERQPKTVHTPMGDIEYKYELRLSEEPKERAFIDVGKQGGTPQRSSESLFERNKRNARLEACSVGEEAFFREHYTNGTLHKERRHQGGQDYAMTYGHSQRGRETFFKDVNDNCQTYLYGNEPGTPAHGQLVSTEIAGVLQGTFEYDDFARMANYTTTDTVGNQSIETLLAYDPFDREIQRTFIFTDNGQRTQQTLVQEYDDRDAMTKRTLTQNLPLPEKLLRQEKYGYDLDQRLTSYECEGPECPLDPAGNVIRSQTFIHDVYNNIEVLITERVGGPGEFSIYHFSAVDPAQLVAIESLPFAANVKLFGLSREQALRLFDAAPPQHRRRIELEYDANGNLTRDEQGRVMEYDRFNRLLKVTVPAADGELVEAQAYGYDGTDILTRTTQANRTEQRFYQSGNASVVGDITIVRGAGGQPLAESQPTEAAQHSVQDPSP